MTASLNILVVEDSHINRILLARWILHAGHTAALAENGLEAVDYCRATVPDVILMDVVMPEMDGIEATRQIRQLLGDRWVPIIFLSANAEIEHILTSLRAGGDDYLPKPIDFELLSAKVSVMVRIAEMRDRIAKNTQELQAYFKQNEAEQGLAKYVLHRISEDEVSEEYGVQRWIKPAVNFSGDVITITRAPTGVLHVMLADSTGHGLSAAISCLPAVSTFRNMTQKGYSISAIAREMNNELRASLPRGRFVAAVLASIDYAEKIVSVWNGGLPQALLVDERGTLLKGFPSEAPPLGILPNNDFDAKLEVYRWLDRAELVLCSDGLTESFNSAGMEFSESSLISAIAAADQGDKFAAICAAISAHLNGEESHDDISLAVIPCYDRSLSKPEPAPTEFVHTEFADWEIRLNFGPRQLRDENCMPALLGWLNQIGLNETQFGEVLLVMSELFNNALDHGILGLSSITKDGPDGFSNYMTERKKRLAALDAGNIEVRLNYRVDAEHASLLISLKDSGDGFDMSSASTGVESEDDDKAHGRGITLVRLLCRRVAYLGNGNHVEAEYALSV